MRVYFDALGGEGGDPPAGLGLAEALERDFGSLRAWHAEFTAMAKAQAGGSGWAMLTWSPRLGRLVNQWAADHAHGLAGGAPILALDMYEHSYHMDFGTRAAAYVDAVMANLEWERIAARYRQARHRRSGGYGAVHRIRRTAGGCGGHLRGRAARRHAARGAGPARCLPRGRHPRRTDMLPGATLRNPDTDRSMGRSCPATSRSRCIASSASRSAAKRSPNCGGAAMTRDR